MTIILVRTVATVDKAIADAGLVNALIGTLELVVSATEVCTK